jgi:Family of unknown function (DUF5681)
MSEGHDPFSPRSRTRQKSDDAQPRGVSDVGYKKPPLHTRFRPGRSGNPNGRPKHSRNLKTVIQQTLTERIVVREGEKTRGISKIEGVVLRQIESALKGNDRAALATLKIAAQVGLLEESAPTTEAVTLTAAEQQIIDEALQKTAHRTSSVKSRKTAARSKLRKQKKQTSSAERQSADPNNKHGS